MTDANDFLRVVELADELMGNWKKFQCFAWSDKPVDADRWAIVYTSNRDADALTRSNAHVIEQALKPFAGWHEDGEDLQFESHGHWAVGHVDGFSVRVRNAQGQITPAFKAYAELALRLQDYPVLDEDDFSEEERTEADETWKNCYSDSERLAYIRKHRSDFEFNSLSDVMGCVRGKYFAGSASELLG